MATKMENLSIEVAHFNNFKHHIPKFQELNESTVMRLLEMGLLQISTAFEHALAQVGNHKVVSLDKGDLYREGQYSDAKLSTVRTSGYGKTYSAPVTKIFNKTGILRVQVYERKQNKFYYFAIPRRAYIDIPKSSNIEIPFDMDGTPRKIPRRTVFVNWWKFQVESWEEMARK